MYGLMVIDNIQISHELSERIWNELLNEHFKIIKNMLDCLNFDILSLNDDLSKIKDYAESYVTTYSKKLRLEAKIEYNKITENINTFEIEKSDINNEYKNLHKKLDADTYVFHKLSDFYEHKKNKDKYIHCLYLSLKQKSIFFLIHHQLVKQLFESYEGIMCHPKAALIKTFFSIGGGIFSNIPAELYQQEKTNLLKSYQEKYQLYKKDFLKINKNKRVEDIKNSDLEKYLTLRTKAKYNKVFNNELNWNNVIILWQDENFKVCNPLSQHLNPEYSNKFDDVFFSHYRNQKWHSLIPDNERIVKHKIIEQIIEHKIATFSSNNRNIEKSFFMEYKRIALSELNKYFKVALLRSDIEGAESDIKWNICDNTEIIFLKEKIQSDKKNLYIAEKNLEKIKIQRKKMEYKITGHQAD